MSRPSLRTATAILLMTAALFAVACDDGDSEYDREQEARSARSFNESQRTPQTVTPGSAASPPAITATATLPPAELRYATVAPITAVFDQSKFTTTYTLTMTGPFPQGGFVEWSGPNCGTIQGDAFSISADQRPDSTVVKPTFAWIHPHPPCGDAPDHSDATIVATLKEGDGGPGKTPRIITTCTYKGSATGTGPTCQIQRETRAR